MMIDVEKLDSETILLGHTLPSLLADACNLHPNPTALNQWSDTGWRSLSNRAFQTKAESLALGLLDLGLVRGDRVALLMSSDVNFAIADMGCAIAGLIDVPIDLTQTLETIVLILKQSGSKALIVSNLELLQQVLPYLDSLHYVLLAEVPEYWQSDDPEHLYSFDQISLTHSTDRIDALYRSLSPQDLATIVYVPGADGEWLGVMLTHESLAGNALAAFATLSRLQWGGEEISLSFLPLTHVFARCLIYGHFYYGHTIYFSTANRVFKHLKEVKPTILATVPLLLERVYSKTLEQAAKLTSKRERVAFKFALQLAKRHKLGQSRVDPLLQKFVARFGLSQWRSLFGDRLKYMLCGGAALKPELATVFAAAGVDIYQGYGLTQASAVVSCNRDRANRAGTVGKLIKGVEIAIAPDHEILVRGAYVMRGYYQNPEATQAAIDPQGWLHTGDFGALTADGFLQVTGQKKALFKLANGKYIAPRPLETRLKRSELVKDAIVMGSGQKMCGALIVPNLEALQKLIFAGDSATISFSQKSLCLGEWNSRLHRQSVPSHTHSQTSRSVREGGLRLSSPEFHSEGILKHPCVQRLYQSIVDEANCHQPYWAAIKRFRLVMDFIELTEAIRLLYSEDKTQDASEFDLQELDCPILPVEACPTFARSLNPRFTTS